MLNLSEKRKFVRFEIPLTVLFRLEGQPESYYQGVACNFSREGLCLIAQDFPFDSNTRLEVKMDVPDKDNTLTISGDVMWRSQSGDRWQAGLRFREIDRTGKMDILEYAYDSWLSKMRTQPR